MAKSLEEIKQQVSARYLGKAGIHSVGMSRKDNALHLYVQAESDAELDIILKAIEEEATPFRVVSIKTDRSRIRE